MSKTNRNDLKCYTCINKPMCKLVNDYEELYCRLNQMDLKAKQFNIDLNCNTYRSAIFEMNEKEMY